MISFFVCALCPLWAAFPGMQSAACFLLNVSDLACQRCFLAAFIINGGSGAKWHLKYSVFVSFCICLVKRWLVLVNLGFRPVNVKKKAHPLSSLRI